MPVTSPSARLRSFAVRGVIWRKYLDWAAENLPFYFYPILIFFCSLFFFCVAGPARRAIARNLALVNPKQRLRNGFRAFSVFQNFAWTIAEAAVHRINEIPFRYDLPGEENLRALSQANGAIVLTAHMGSYDLGAALFGEKFDRQIRIVRAREADPESARHLDDTLRDARGGGVRVDYNTGEAALSFELLNALRAGEIVSLQGDRVVENVAAIEVELFNEKIRIPAGPFTLALVTGTEIYPLFISRLGFRHYEVNTCLPFRCVRTTRGRQNDLDESAQIWADILKETLKRHQRQWFAFTPVW